MRWGRWVWLGVLATACGPKKAQDEDARKACLSRARTDEAARACWNDPANEPVVGTWRMAGPGSHTARATFTLDGRQLLELVGPKGKQTKESYFSLSPKGNGYQMEVYDCRPGLPDCGGSPRQILELERSNEGRRLKTKTLEGSGARGNVTVWDRED